MKLRQNLVQQDKKALGKIKMIIIYEIMMIIIYEVMIIIISELMLIIIYEIMMIIIKSYDETAADTWYNIE